MSMQARWLVPICLLALAWGCDVSSNARQVYFGSDVVAHVRHRWLQAPDRVTGSFQELERVVTLGRDHIATRYGLSKEGFIEVAGYMRAGSWGTRVLQVTPTHWVDASSGEKAPLPDEYPRVSIETLSFVDIDKPTSVGVIDFASAGYRFGELRNTSQGVELFDENGELIAEADRDTTATVGPGAFSEGYPASPPGNIESTQSIVSGRGQLVCAEGIPVTLAELDAPGQRPTSKAGCFQTDLSYRPQDSTESVNDLFWRERSREMEKFAREQRRENHTRTALALANAIHTRTDWSLHGAAPSARGVFERKRGDCDDAAALLASLLRYLNIDAYPVVGYLIVGDSLEPHAWTEFREEDGRWRSVDATRPAMGPFSDHIRLFRGLGDALTMGRVLGRVRFTRSRSDYPK